MELRYDRRLEAVGDELTFETPDNAGDYILRVEKFVSSLPPRVFDVTDAYAPRELTNSTTRRRAACSSWRSRRRRPAAAGIA